MSAPDRFDPSRPGMPPAGQPVRLLLIGDSEIDERLMRSELERSPSRDRLSLERVMSMAEAQSALRGQAYHAVLLDLSLPGLKPAETVTQLRGQSPKTAIIVLCRFESDPQVAQCLKLGAQEYLVKGLYLADPMMVVIGHAVESAHLAGIYDAASTLLMYEALSRDPQTGLMSRHVLRDVGRYASGVALRSGGQLALCYLEVGGLLPDQDDSSAKQIAEILLDGTRATDAVARLGAEEFALLLGPVISQTETDRVIQRIVERISQLPREPERQMPLRVGAGVAQLPRHTDNYDQLLVNAGLACRSSRMTTGVRVGFYNLSQRGGTTRAI